MITKELDARWSDLEPPALPDTWRGDFVERDEAGAIKGAYRQPQPGIAEEPVAENDPELVAFLGRVGAPARRLVPKSLIVERLHAAGKLAAASAALNADLFARERWYAPDKPAIYADDPEALALLKAIGADPDAILAP